MKYHKNLDHILINYFKKTFKSNDNKLINLIVILIRIIHIIGIIFLFLGFLLPAKSRDYHIIWCLKTLLLWYIFDGKCYLTMFINYIKDNDIYEEFLPMSQSITNFGVFFVLTASIAGLMYPEYSAFNLIKYFIAYLETYN
jgi:hypothetical protein